MSAGRTARPRSGRKGAGEPSRIEMKLHPGQFGLNGSGAKPSVRTPFEPMLDATIKAIEERLSELPKDQAAKDRSVIERQRGHIDRAFEAMRGLNDPALREALVDGFGGALALGFFHHGGPHLVAEARKKRVKPAIDANRTPLEVSQILNKRAQECWEKKPVFLNNSTGTAKQIWKRVAEDLDALSTLTGRWEKYCQASLKNLPDDHKLVKGFVAAIRKSIERMKP